MSQLAVCAVVPVRMCVGVHFPLCAPNCTHIYTNIMAVVEDKGLRCECMCACARVCARAVQGSRNLNKTNICESKTQMTESWDAVLGRLKT